MTVFSLADLTTMLKAAQRELQMRLRVYPRWVELGRMTQKEADAELQAMRLINTLLAEQIAQKTGVQTELFNEG